MVFEGAEVLNDRDFTSLLAWMRFVHDDSTYKSELAQQRASGMQRASIPVLVKGRYQPPVTITQTGRAPTISYQPKVPMNNDESPLNIFSDIGAFALKL